MFLTFLLFSCFVLGLAIMKKIITIGMLITVITAITKIMTIIIIKTWVARSDNNTTIGDNNNVRNTGNTT